MADLAVMSHLEGQELGGCRLIRKLGAGGMGEIYLAEQRSLGDRLVVVKVVRASDPTLQQSVTESLERLFTREGKLLGRFAHPNLLPVHYGGMKDGLLYLVMQYAPDGSLADAIHGGSDHPLRLPLNVPFAMNLVDQVATALQYTHDHGVVHRDVKPGNVLVQIEPSGRWHLLLADFGIAHSIDTTIQPNGATGTFAYMAPEQFSGRFSPASDQYSLGVMTYLLLTGRVPFQGALPTLMQAHLYRTPPAMGAYNPAVPASVEAVVARALAKDPAQRFPSVMAFAQALRSAALETGATRPVLATGMATGAALAARAPRPRPEGVDQPTQIVDTTPTRPVAGAAVGYMGTTEAAAPPTRPFPLPASAAQTSFAPRRRRRPLVFILLAVSAMLLIVGLLALAQAHLPAQSSAGKSQTPPAHARYQSPGGAPGSVGDPPATLGPQATATAQQSGSQAAVAAPSDRAQVVAQPAPITVRPGQQFTTSITFLNVGTTSWSNSTGYRLVCDSTRHPTSNCPPNVAVAFGQNTVAPGQTVIFTAGYVAPAAPGVYRLWWNISHNGAIFTSPDAYVEVTVLAPQAQPTQPAATQPPQSTPPPSPTSTAAPPPQATQPAPAPQPTTAPAAPPPPQPTSGPAATPAATPIGSSAPPGSPRASPTSGPQAVVASTPQAATTPPAQPTAAPTSQPTPPPSLSPAATPHNAPAPALQTSPQAQPTSQPTNG